MGDRDILSTLRYHDYPQWTSRVEILDREGLSIPAFVRCLRAAALRYRTVVLTGTWRADQLAAIALARMRRPPRVLMTDATWKRGSSRLDRAAGALGMGGMRGEHMTFCVLSSWELRRFPSTWGVDPAQVRFTPFCFTLTERQLSLPVSEGGGVFAGGDSLRDYRPLLKAASSVDAPITIASRTLGTVKAPPNVRSDPVSPDRFEELNRQASVVVVALQGLTDRSAGQQTYLNAMALGKSVVVTDAPGVRDYVRDQETGLIVPPEDPAAMAAAIRWLLDPANEREVGRMRERARDVVRSRYSRKDYIAAILRVVDESPGPLPLTAPGG